MKKTAHTLTVFAAIPLASIMFTGCESMSPEGAQAFDAATAAARPPEIRVTDAGVPAPRAADYPLTGPAHPSTLTSPQIVQPMPIPVPVPRQ
jgi:hypothetical protein